MTLCVGTIKAFFMTVNSKLIERLAPWIAVVVLVMIWEVTVRVPYGDNALGREHEHFFSTSHNSVECVDIANSGWPRKHFRGRLAGFESRSATRKRGHCRKYSANRAR